METFFGIVLCIFGAFIVFMSAHVVNEQKHGRTIPLPWETKRKIFDKSNIKYRDGDNT